MIDATESSSKNMIEKDGKWIPQLIDRVDREFDPQKERDKVSTNSCGKNVVKDFPSENFNPILHV